MTTVVVNGAEGLTMTQARRAWPCCEATWRKIRDARDRDGRPILRTYPQAPGSSKRITTHADIQAAREALARIEDADDAAAIERLTARPETALEALDRIRRERAATRP
jgi:hypothetical protein